jgi:hypothetical protein
MLPDAAHELLEAAEIPEDSDLEVVCARRHRHPAEADILDNLPDELRELFGSWHRPRHGSGGYEKGGFTSYESKAHLQNPRR